MYIKHESEVIVLKERLKILRKSLGLSQKAFGEPLHLTGSGIANYEQGLRTLTDRTISDICRVYNVSETWLRNGEGEMLAEGQSIDAELSALVAELINSDDEWLKNCIVRFLKLSPQSREIFKNFLSELFENGKGA